MVHALRGKEHVEWENPYDVGMTGLIGFSSGYYAMRDCDILLMLGTDFPYRQFYPDEPGVRIAQIDLQAGNIGRRAKVDLGILGDVRSTLQALLPLLKKKDSSAKVSTISPKALNTINDSIDSRCEWISSLFRCNAATWMCL